MFDRGGWKRPEREDERKEDMKKPEPRFSPKIIAAQYGKPLPEYTRDRVFEDYRPTSSGPSKPKKIQKSKAPPKDKQPTQTEQKPMKDFAIERGVPPAQEAGQAPEGIQSTKQYDGFRLLPTNRPIDKAHVRKLMSAIRKKNMLHLNPIVVNSRFEVIDGQHRLEAAKQLGVQIFFTQDAQVSQDDIASMNSNKKNWALADYLHFHEAQGLPAYVEFMNFYREHGAGLPIALVLSLCTEKGSVKSSYKDGILDISGLSTAREVIKYLSDYKPYTQFATTSKFVEALAFIVRTGLYDHAQMIMKLNGNPGALQPQPQTKGWILELQRAYNKHVREDKIVMFLKRI